jgi:hypothetical protein
MILTVVLVGGCLVFLIVGKIFKASMKRIQHRQQEKLKAENTIINDHTKLSPVLQVDAEDLKIDPKLLPEQDGAEEQDESDDDKETETGDEHSKNESSNPPTPSPVAQKTLALLYPPGLMGGYRNQVIRLLSLVVTAKKRKIHNLLLPSLLWTTQISIDGKETWVPIPHDLVFDVDHWNTFSPILPKLIEASPDMDCWTTNLPNNSSLPLLSQEVVKRGFLTPVANLSHSLVTRDLVINLRLLDVLRNVSSHCDTPLSVYGGGTGAGRLWRDYSNIINKKGDFLRADSTILKALRPKQEWRDLATSCPASKTSKDYIALHARMELEMMGHSCGREMERNLTRLFQHVQDLAEELKVGGVFVAVSRSGIEIKNGTLYDKFKVYADENLDALNRVVGDGVSDGAGLLGGDVKVFECGQHLMDKYYSEHPHSIDYGSLLQSVVNFYIATEAKAFVGVRGSSYSTDIWTTRYHQGKGDSNYEYTKEGIVKMGNGGLPPMHTNCGKAKK